MDYFTTTDEIFQYEMGEASRSNSFQAIKIGNDSDLQCNSYRSNSTIIIIPGGYEGIPQNLLINFIAWLVIVDTSSNCNSINLTKFLNPRL